MKFEKMRNANPKYARVKRITWIVMDRPNNYYRMHGQPLVRSRHILDPRWKAWKSS